MFKNFCDESGHTFVYQANANPKVLFQFWGICQCGKKILVTCPACNGVATAQKGEPGEGGCDRCKGEGVVASGR